jgi:hypothetical protein
MKRSCHWSRERLTGPSWDMPRYRPLVSGPASHWPLQLGACWSRRMTPGSTEQK